MRTTLLKAGLFLWATTIALALAITPIYYGQMQFSFRLFPRPADGLALLGLLWASSLLMMLPAGVLLPLAAFSRRGKVVWTVAGAWAALVALFLLTDTASLSYSGSHLIFYLSYLADMAANPELAGFEMVGGWTGLLKPTLAVGVAGLLGLGLSYGLVRQVGPHPRLGLIVGALWVFSLLYIPVSQLLWSDFVASSLAYQRQPISLPWMGQMVAQRRSRGVRIAEVAASNQAGGRVVLHNFGPALSLEGWQLVSRLKTDKLSGTLEQDADLTIARPLDPRSEWLAIRDAQGQEVDSLQYTPASLPVALALPYKRPETAELKVSTRALESALRANFSSTKPPPPPSGLSGDKDVIIVMAESWRRDSFTAEGAPQLTRWARKGLVLAQHYSGANATHLGLYSLLYGRSAIDFRHDLSLGMPATLPQALHSCGYQTSYFCATSSIGWKWMERIITSQSFDEIHLGSESMAPTGHGWVEKDREYFSSIPKLLRDREKPQLVVLHPMSTHFPYPFPPSFDKRRPSGEMDHQLLASASQEVLKNRYFNSVLYLDSLLGQMLSGLDMSKTIVIVTGDHGEAIWDDGTIAHATRASEVQLAVPFVMLGAGVSPGRVDDKPTYHADITPTVLQALKGAPVNIPGTHGISVLAPFDRDSVPIVPSTAWSPYSLIFLGQEARLGFTIEATTWFSGRADLGPLDGDTTVAFDGNVRADGTTGKLPANLDFATWNKRLLYWAGVLSR